MTNEKKLTCALIIAVAALLVSVGTLVTVAEKEPADNGLHDVKYTLYIGTTAVSETEATAIQERIIEDIVLGTYQNGYTSYLATGCTYDPDRQLYIPDNYTIVLELSMVTDSTLVDRMIADIRELPTTGVVLSERTLADDTLYL